jgi:hypothetical protein
LKQNSSKIGRQRKTRQRKHASFATVGVKYRKKYLETSQHQNDTYNATRYRDAGKNKFIFIWKNKRTSFFENCVNATADSDHTTTIDGRSFEFALIIVIRDGMQAPVTNGSHLYTAGIFCGFI